MHDHSTLHTGMFTGDSSPDDKLSFVTERHCFLDLLTGLASPCSCGVTGSPWSLDSVTQKGHVLRVQFICRRCRQPRTWASSRVLASHYVVNQKYIGGCGNTCITLMCYSQGRTWLQLCGDLADPVRKVLQCLLHRTRWATLREARYEMLLRSVC